MFIYSADGVNRNAFTKWNQFYPFPGLTTSAIGFQGELQQIDIRDWTASGGGYDSYGSWAQHFWNPKYNDYVMCATPNIPYGTPLVYFGNWLADKEGTAEVDVNGFTQSDVRIFNTDPDTYGTEPVTITQVVTGLTVGERYRFPDAVKGGIG